MFESNKPLFLLGDVHGIWPKAQAKINEVAQANPEGAVILCLGEMGYYLTSKFYVWKTSYSRGSWPPPLCIPDNIDFLWIDGNHEDHPAMKKAGLFDAQDLVQEYALDGGFVNYVPRGAIIKIQGRKILCMGGGNTVPWDIQPRLKAFARKSRYVLGLYPSWNQLEEITQEQIDLALANVEAVGGIDWVCSHQPPARFELPGITPLAVDLQSSRHLLDAFVLLANPKQWYFADMHMSCAGQFGQIKWQGINKEELIKVL